jgi:type IV secretory pathway VirB2 component (pilin)
MSTKSPSFFYQYRKHPLDVSCKIVSFVTGCLATLIIVAGILGACGLLFLL